MAPQTSAPPPPPSGGSAKYIVILLILLLGAGGVWFAMGSRDQAAAPPPPPPKAAERETSLADDSLVIPEPEEELPEEEPAEEPVEEQPKKPSRPARDPWACKGDLPPAEIRKVINSSRSTIRACYERRLKNVNMLQGSLTVQVKVGPSGEVAATRVRGSLHDSDVRACVQGQARQWKFPAPSGGCVVFEAPYNFTPKN